jgi:hypothetical protein
MLLSTLQKTLGSLSVVVAEVYGDLPFGEHLSVGGARFLA